MRLRCAGLNGGPRFELGFSCTEPGRYPARKAPPRAATIVEALQFGRLAATFRAYRAFLVIKPMNRTPVGVILNDDRPEELRDDVGWLRCSMMQ